MRKEEGKKKKKKKQRERKSRKDTNCCYLNKWNDGRRGEAFLCSFLQFCGFPMVLSFCFVFFFFPPPLPSLKLEYKMKD